MWRVVSIAGVVLGGAILALVYVNNGESLPGTNECPDPPCGESDDVEERCLGPDCPDARPPSALAMNGAPVRCTVSEDLLALRKDVSEMAVIHADATTALTDRVHGFLRSGEGVVMSAEAMLLTETVRTLVEMAQRRIAEMDTLIETKKREIEALSTLITESEHEAVIDRARGVKAELKLQINELSDERPLWRIYQDEASRQITVLVYYQDNLSAFENCYEQRDGSRERVALFANLLDEGDVEGARYEGFREAERLLGGRDEDVLDDDDILDVLRQGGEICTAIESVVRRLEPAIAEIVSRRDRVQEPESEIVGVTYNLYYDRMKAIQKELSTRSKTLTAKKEKLSVSLIDTINKVEAWQRFLSVRGHETADECAVDGG